MQLPIGSEDLRPETGPGSCLLERISINLRQLRLAAGIERTELARRAALHVNEVSRLEGDGAREPRVTTTLRLAHSLGASLDQLAERVYWDPGQVLTKSNGRQSAERLSGFFLVLPDNVPVFEPVPPRDPVGTRQEAAGIFGANVRDARERRHLTQQAMGAAAGLSKAGLSLIERGVRETTVETLLALARVLEVPPELLLEGIWWRPPHLGRIPKANGVSCQVHSLNSRPSRRRSASERAPRPRDACAQMPPRGRQWVAAGRIAAEKDIAARIGTNMAHRRKEAGLTLRQLAEATEADRTYLHRIERGRSGLPQLAIILKLAGSLNVRYGLIVAGISWDVDSQSFRVVEGAAQPHTDRKRLGLNVSRARHRLDLSQKSLSDRASMSRSDLVDFERASRNFRIFTVVRLAAALEVGFADLFAGLTNWYVRPLPAPEYGPVERPGRTERDLLLMRLWREGRSETEIAEALDLARTSVGPYIRELRDGGECLPYRRPPRGAVESAARRRRDRRAKGPSRGFEPHR